MHKFFVSLGAIALSCAAPAQEMLQCVNPDVLNSLVYSARPEMKLALSRGMPANADGFRAPAGFSLIGSGVRGADVARIVAYRTELDSATAFERLLQSLSGEGWKREVAQQPPIANMVLPAAPANTATVCRNGERRFVQVRDVGGVHYATISTTSPGTSHACDTPAPQPTGFGNPAAAMSAARALLPQFTFPDGTRLLPAGPDAGMFNGVTSATARIESPDSAANLSRHLSRQLAEQGWKSDAEWSGKLSTGSTWTRRGADGEPMWGTLEILSPGAGVYEVGFMLVGATI